jgi:tetratricopeptide (TPR) repeat protein
VVFSRVGDNVRACAAYRESIESLDELNRIGGVKSINGKPWSTDLLVASTKQLLAESLTEVGRHDEGTDYSKEAMNLAKHLFHEYQSDPEVCHQVIKILQGHANLVFRTSGVGSSERDVAQEMETALKLAKAMRTQFPNEATSAALVATIACDYSLVCNQKGLIKQARDLITESIQIREELAARFPHRPALLVEQSNSHDRYAGILHDQQKYDEAIKQYRIAVALDERASQSDEFDRSLGFRRMAIGKQQNLSNTLWRTRNLEGRLDECRQIRERTVAEWKSLVDEHSDQPDLKADYAMALYALADLKSAADSIELVNESVAIMRTLCEAFPNNPGHKSRLTTCLKALAGFYISNRQPELAIETAQSSIRVAEELAQQWPTVPDYRGKIARRYRLLGQIYLHLKENSKAVECFQNALKSREQLQSLSSEYSTSMYAIPVASLHTLLAVAHRRMNDPENDILARVHFDTAAKMAVEANAIKDLGSEVTFMLNSQERQILSQFIAKTLESRYDDRAHESESESR